MDLTEYYVEVVKTAGLVGPSEEDTKEAIAALELAAEGDETIDVEAAEECLKTAGLLTEEDSEEESEEPSEEKIAAVVAVAEQFEIDGVDFENEEEKIAAAEAIVEGFEKVALDRDQRLAKAQAEHRDAAAGRETAKGDARIAARAEGRAGNVAGKNKFSKGLKAGDARAAAHRKTYQAALHAKAGEKGSVKRHMTMAGTKAKHLLGRVDQALHGHNVDKKLGMSVKNWRRAGTGAAVAGGAAYLAHRKSQK